MYVCLVKAFNGIVAAVLSRSAIAAAGFYELNAISSLSISISCRVRCPASLADSYIEHAI